MITTTDSKEQALTIADALVRRRLAGCVQVIGPITSTYWWNEAVETAEEWLCLIKTAQEKYGEVERAIREAHSYDVPEVLAVPVVAASESYLTWLAEELQKTKERRTHGPA